MADEGRLEVVHDLAAQLPSRLTAKLLGFPEDRWEDIRSWSERLMRTDAVTFDNDAAMGVMSAIMEFNPLLQETAAERSGCPADDLVSVWTGAGMGPLPMMHETGLFIAGGAETTRTVIGRGLAVLAEHPDQWEAAAADPSLVPGLVEEVIRWVTLLNNMFRRALADDHIGEQPGRGDRAMPAYLSANRTRRCSTTRSGSTSAATRTPISPSGRARTSASAPTWPASSLLLRADPAVDQPPHRHAPGHRAEHLRRCGPRFDLAFDLR